MILVPLLGVPVNADQVLNREIRMSSAIAGVSNVIYRVSFDIPVNSNVGSTVIEFCDNNPFPEEPCTAPAGFSATGTAPNAQSGIMNFGLNPGSTVNKVILSRPAAALFGPGTVRFELNNIRNPFAVAPFYARITTYPTLDGTGPWNNSGGIALMTSESFNVSATVPPFLYFCAAISFSGYDCDSATQYVEQFGEFSTVVTKTATSQMILGTNADFGLTVTVNGTSLTSGNDIIMPMSAQRPSVKNTPQFGLNLRANNDPAVGTDPMGPGGAIAAPGYDTVNRFKFASGDTVITADDVVDYRKFTVSYIVNINKSQAPGMYSTTLTYNCLANF